MSKRIPFLRIRVRRTWKRDLAVLLTGIVIGAAGLLIAGTLYLRQNLIRTYTGAVSYDEVLQKLPETVNRNMQGWTCEAAPPPCGAMPPDSKVTMFKLCNGDYAAQLLKNPEDYRAGSIIPCTFVLSAADDGKCRLTRVNTRLAGLIMGGETGRLFSGEITREQEALLDALYFTAD